MHISCIVARLLNKMTSTIKGIHKDNSENTEMLISGCAAGISACFASPIGGRFLDAPLIIVLLSRTDDLIRLPSQEFFTASRLLRHISL